VAEAPSFDFARIPASYGFVPFRGLPVTNLSVPDAKSSWQRARRADADLDNSSAFQMHCFDAASYINTWTFPYRAVSGGGAHAIYGYSFNGTTQPAIFDADPGTDFVLQASLEIPLVVTFPDPSLAQPEPVGQVAVFAYFRDRFTGKTFALLLGVFDSRSATVATYTPAVAHDGATPFVSVPFGGAVYATTPAVSARFTGTPWQGLRFFRAHVTQDNFRRALADINAYCRAHLLARYCDRDPFILTAYSSDVSDYEITDCGVIHEIFRDGPDSNISMAVHVYDLGAWNFR